MSEITDLTKTFREENAENRAQTERIANSTVGGGVSTEDRLIARRTLDAQDKILKEQMKAGNFSEASVEKLGVLNQVAEAQKASLEESRASLEKLGIDAESNKEYQKQQMELAKTNLASAKASGSKDAEKKAKEEIYNLRQNTFLGKIANGITDIKKAAKEKIKSGLKKGFGAFAFGALAIAAIAFLNSPYFDKAVKFINESIIPAITGFYESIKNGGQKIITLFTGTDKDGNPVGLFDRIAGIFSSDSLLVMGLTTIVGLFAASKIAKLIGPLKGAIGGILKGLGGLTNRLPTAPTAPGGAGGAGPGAGTRISRVAGNLKKSAISAGKGIGGFLKGVLKGIAGGLSAIANPAVLLGLAAVTAAIILMEDSFEPLGKLVESVGKAVKSTFEGIGEIVESIGTGIGTMITKIGDSIGNIIDKVSKMKSAGTDATTKQIKELSKIPAEPMLAVANGINAMKKALDGFGGGTLSKIAGSLFDGGGPIDKIVELTKKVPELMKAAEAISVLGQAGSNYAMAEQELERRKRIGELQKDLASGDVDGNNNAKNVAKAQAELAALQGQSMPMSSNIGGNLGKIEKLVQEIVTMKREAAKGGGNVGIDASTKVNAPSSVSLGGSGTQLTNPKTFAYDGQV